MKSQTPNIMVLISNPSISKANHSIVPTLFKENFNLQIRISKWEDLCLRLISQVHGCAKHSI